MSESHDIEQIARLLCRDELEICLGMNPAKVVTDEEVAAMIDKGWTYYEDRAKPILPLIRAAEERGAENMRERAAGEAVMLPGDGEPADAWMEGYEAAFRDIEKAIRALPPIKEG